MKDQIFGQLYKPYKEDKSGFTSISNASIYNIGGHCRNNSSEILEGNCRTWRQLDNSQVRRAGFLERGTGIHQSNIVLYVGGLAPTIDACQYKEPYKVITTEVLNVE